ncbi:hypothetical protein ACJMK2_029111, partial [Sinanodonta woodiana]
MPRKVNQTPEKASPSITLTEKILEEFNKSMVENENLIDQDNFNVSKFSQSESPVKFDQQRNIDSWLSKVDSTSINYLIHKSKSERDMQLNRSKLNMQKAVKCTFPVKKEPRKSSFEQKETPIFIMGTMQMAKHESEGRQIRQHDTDEFGQPKELGQVARISSLEYGINRVEEMTSNTQNASLDRNDDSYYSSQNSTKRVDFKGSEVINAKDFKCAQQNAFLQQMNRNKRDVGLGNTTNYDSGYPDSINQEKTHESLIGRPKQTNYVDNSFSKMQAALLRSDANMNTTFDIKTSVFNSTAESKSQGQLTNHMPSTSKDQNSEMNNNSKATLNSLRKPKALVIGKQPPPINAALFRKIRTSELVKMLKSPKSQIAKFISPKLVSDDETLDSELEMELYTVDKCEHDGKISLAEENLYNPNRLLGTCSGKNGISIDEHLSTNKRNQYTVQKIMKDNTNVYSTHSEGRNQGSFTQKIQHKMQENASSMVASRPDIQNYNVLENNLQPNPLMRNITSGFHACEKTKIMPNISKYILSAKFGDLEQRSTELGTQRTSSLGSPVHQKKMAFNEGNPNNYSPSRSFRTLQNMQTRSSDNIKGFDPVIDIGSQACSVELATKIHKIMQKKALESQLQKVRNAPLIMASDENCQHMHFVQGEKPFDVNISRPNVHHPCSLETSEFESGTGTESHCKVSCGIGQSHRLRPDSSPIKPGKSLKTQDLHNEEKTPSKPRPKTSVSFKDQTEDVVMLKKCDVVHNHSAISTPVKKQIPISSNWISPKSKETLYKSQKEPESGQKYPCSSNKANASSPQGKHIAKSTHFIEISSKDAVKKEFRSAQKQKPLESRRNAMSPVKNLDVYSFSKNAESPATSMSKLRLQTADDIQRYPVKGANSVQSKLHITQMTSQPTESEKGKDQVLAGKSRKNLFRVSNAVQPDQRPVNMKVAHPSTPIFDSVPRTLHIPKQQYQPFKPSGHNFNYAQSTPVRPGIQFNLDETL